MVGRLIVLGVLLVSLIGAITLHYTLHQNPKESSLQTLTRLTTITAPSLSVAYYEPRLPSRLQESHPSYPQMPTINRRGFIYDY